jgi:diguanylate cyclase (GGDEF)-like protein/PAS domain S-box-containing protein
MLWHGLLWLSGVLVLAWMVSRIQGLLKEKYDVVSELSKQHQTLTAILSHAPLGIRLQDPSGRLQFVNKAFCEAFGMSEQQLLALDNYAQQYPPQAARVSLAADAEALVQEKPHYSAEQILLADGYEHEFDMIRVRHVDSSGRTSGLITLGLDVTEKKAAQARISHLAYYDSLTGLPNRLQVLERLQQDIARARRHGHSGALLMIDLDQFKTINDSLGHPLGDALLRRIAARLDDDKRAEDFVGRLGGDEFVVLLPEIADSLEFTARSASQKANFLRDYLSKPCTVKGHELHITVSIGVALFPAGQEQANDVLQQADTALFRAKEAGRNAVRFFAPAMQQAANERLSMQTALRRALDNAEFDLAFQPQVGSEGKLKGAEVLLRWTRGEGGPVSPAVFIPIAEETGIVHRLGEFVLRGACERLSIWRKHPLLRVLSISVNVSPRQFRQADFVPRLEALLAEFSVDPRRLMLELTEGVVISDVEDTCSKMAALKRIGVCLSIDDFGTGYSSLSYLKRLPLDELKIDQSFVRDIISDANDAAIVETIVAMAGHLGLEVIAEGVESAEVLACLRQKGCRAFQGYYFGRPGPVEDTENLLLRDLSG